MKTIRHIGLNLIFMLCSLSVCAHIPTHSHKIPVTGYPVYLDNPRSMYLVPDTFETSVDGNFVTIDNVRHVCYLLPQPELNALNKKIITTNIKGVMLYWTCYQFDPNYFIIIP
ncbi:hypothetical protein [Legionella bononiensis]|uniref:Uncharacterized protein n=1 Tax=Legionella bononiensis TaxID=2793102 RepID=A0ABS1WDC6_9GAMM|nr:hypothetical protein [Legionella bononiensis]MBL7527349.1 hypothetical protein [Legionella bononiensis]